MSFLKTKTHNLKPNFGFTLIELLVVIAIIGILSGIVLTSLGTARNKAKMASASASLASARSQAEIGVDNSGKYIIDLSLTTNTNTGSIGNLVKAANDQIGGTITAGVSDVVVCNQNAAASSQGTKWAASADLNALSAPAAARYYCVDSTGFAGTRASALAAGTTDALSVCPAS